jgi:hypothetical protein
MALIVITLIVIILIIMPLIKLTLYDDILHYDSHYKNITLHAEYHNAKCRYVEFYFACCHYAERLNAEFHSKNPIPA